FVELGAAHIRRIDRSRDAHALARGRHRGVESTAFVRDLGRRRRWSFSVTDPAELAQFHAVAREQDFRAVFDQEVGYVWNVMRRVGVPEPERNDLTQEVFLTVYTLFDDYDRSRPIKPWLFGIAYRTA